jgi:rSAM/selenodomain-associated transferase 1
VAAYTDAGTWQVKHRYHATVAAPGTDILLVFVKEPRAGGVKSRLAARIGKERAARVYKAIAEEEIRRTAPRDDEFERLFLFSPPQSRARMEEWLPGETLVPQVEGDLGQRMARAFDEAFRRGARRVAVIGTDVPSLSREDVLDALCSLDDQDLVIGPASDGGYYLLAMKRPDPGLFQGVPWSTPQVLTATLDRAGRLGRSVRVLRTLGDVDTVEDLAADWGRIAPILPEPLRQEVAALVGRE